MPPRVSVSLNDPILQTALRTGALDPRTYQELMGQIGGLPSGQEAQRAPIYLQPRETRYDQSLDRLEQQSQLTPSNAAPQAASAQGGNLIDQATKQYQQQLLERMKETSIINDTMDGNDHTYKIGRWSKNNNESLSGIADKLIKKYDLNMTREQVMDLIVEENKGTAAMGGGNDKNKIIEGQTLKLNRLFKEIEDKQLAFKGSAKPGADNASPVSANEETNSNITFNTDENKQIQSYTVKQNDNIDAIVKALLQSLGIALTPEAISQAKQAIESSLKNDPANQGKAVNLSSLPAGTVINLVDVVKTLQSK